MNFPKDFVWGAATASYQIEGAAEEDGRQPSVWDAFSHEKGKTRDGYTGDIACDHYHHQKEDIQLLSDLGIKNYRFSVAWPRILNYQSAYGPQAVKGTVNQKGLDFYDRLIDGLLEKGITPWMTLFHWDLPMELEHRGGWRNREIMYWAADYAEIIARKYGDRVKNFFTINEMPCVLGGYDSWMAPGLKVSQKELLNVTHNLLLTQGTMAKVLRQNTPAGSQIGFAHCGAAPFPLTDSQEDVEAFRKAVVIYEGHPEYYAPKKGSGRYLSDSLTYWCDPIYLGHYPEGAQEAFGKDMPQILDGDMKIISEPLDFHAQNIYQGPAICAPVAEEDKCQGFSIQRFAQGYPITAAKWPVTPRSMNYFTRFINERYKKPVYISENGLSGADVISLDGKCHDPQRIDFTHRYLKELGKAIEAGADIRGYFHWSLMDNFEWARGYEERFGMVYVDYETQVRTPKDSAYWYKNVIETNGAGI